MEDYKKSDFCWASSNSQQMGFRLMPKSMSPQCRASLIVWKRFRVSRAEARQKFAGLLQSNFNQITILQIPCYLLYLHTMGTYFKFLNSKPVCVPRRPFILSRCISYAEAPNEKTTFGIGEHGGGAFPCVAGMRCRARDADDKMPSQGCQ